MPKLHEMSRVFNTLAIVIVAVMLTGGVSSSVRLRSASSPLLPEGSSTPGRAGAEESALELARSLDAVPESKSELCPDDRLRVSWEEPEGNPQVGSFLPPVGPPPTLDTTDVNGIVICAGSTYGFLGFEAHWQKGRWVLYPVPDLPEEVHIGEGGTAVGAPLTVLPAGLGNFESNSPWSGQWGPEIEPLANYEPQRKCDPSPKAGTAAFATLVRQVYPTTRSYGISRQCEVGDLSEHKEGRAWDWGVSVAAADESRAANELISWLLATDEFGNEYAMARRLGVMYVIWDRHVWASYRADAGWRPYIGQSPHSDHVHISFSRDGGDGETSFWDAVDLQRLAGDDLFGGLPPAFHGFDQGHRLILELGRAVARTPRGPTARSGRTTTSSSSSTTTSSLPLAPGSPPDPSLVTGGVGVGGSSPLSPSSDRTTRDGPPPTTARGSTGASTTVRPPTPSTTVSPAPTGTRPAPVPSTIGVRPTLPPSTGTTRAPGTANPPTLPSVTVPPTRPTVPTTIRPPTIPTTLPTVPTTVATIPPTPTTLPTTPGVTVPTIPIGPGLF